MLPSPEGAFLRSWTNKSEFFDHVLVISSLVKDFYKELQGSLHFPFKS